MGRVELQGLGVEVNGQVEASRTCRVVALHPQLWARGGSRVVVVVCVSGTAHRGGVDICTADAYVAVGLQDLHESLGGADALQEHTFGHYCEVGTTATLTQTPTFRHAHRGELQRLCEFEYLW